MRSRKAFIFSLNRDVKMMSTVRPQYASYNNKAYGPTYGGGHDLHIANYCNRNKNSYTNLGHTYKVPSNYRYGGNARSLLAGSYQFKCSDYEVYYLTTASQRRAIAKRIREQQRRRRQISKRMRRTLGNSRVLKRLNSHMKNRLYNFVSPVTPYNKQWTRCFIASRDSFLARKFHQRCDNKGATLTLVRSGGYVFGGYNSNSWKSEYFT